MIEHLRIIILKKYIYSFQKWYIAVKHLDPCFLTTFCKKQVLRGTFGEIWRIQIQMYPKTYVELKYGACYLKNEVSSHRLGSVVQLSWRVAPPYKIYKYALWKYLTVGRQYSCLQCPPDLGVSPDPKDSRQYIQQQLPIKLVVLVLYLTFHEFGKPKFSRFIYLQ